MSHFGLLDIIVQILKTTLICWIKISPRGSTLLPTEESDLSLQWVLCQENPDTLMSENEDVYFYFTDINLHDISSVAG